MLSILLSWIVIAFVFLSFGSFFVFIYNKVTAQGENYSFFDEFFLGLCFTTILLSLSSFFLPSNHYILGIYILLGIIYWIIRQKYLRQRIVSFRDKVKKIGPLYWVWIVGFGITLVLYTLWATDEIDWVPTSFDSLYYHQASIRWNEEYPIIKGLANLEERIGFNSNYMLIAAPFTLRFLFDTPIYAIQSAVALILFLWVVSEVAKNKFDVKRIVVLLLYAALIFLFKNELNLTSTDIIPVFTVFYLGAKAVLYPQQLKGMILLYTVLPVYVITLKLSSALVAISSILFIFYLIKTKNIRSCVFLTICCLLVLVPWLVRNVILSGYLIYPFYRLDLFSVDWKVPLDIAIKESDYIAYHAKNIYLNEVMEKGLTFDVKNSFFWHFVTLIIGILSFIACTIFIFMKRKGISGIYWCIYIIIALSYVFFILYGPSVRFCAGFVAVLILLLACIIVDNKKKMQISEELWWNSKKYNLYVLIFVSVFSVYTVVNNYRRINNYRNALRLSLSISKKKAIKIVLKRQFSAKESYALMAMKEKRYLYYDIKFEPYVLNNGIIVYISRERRGFLYDIIPSVPNSDTDKEWAIFQDYRNLEGRGESVKDGFKSKLNDE